MLVLLCLIIAAVLAGVEAVRHRSLLAVAVLIIALVLLVPALVAL